MNTNRKTVRELGDVKGQRLFIRVDYNVPVENGTITDDTRIRASLPTLELLRKAGARLVLASHLGRPKKGPAPELSLKPVAARLAELLKAPVAMAPDSVGPDVSRLAEGLPDGGVLLLENVRFYKEEEANDPAFAQRLIDDSGATIFVNDAFGTAHRAHASTAGVAPCVKARVAGLLMEKELKYLGLALSAPEHPFVAILGGAKVSDKIQVIESLLPRVDALLIGGGMAYTFFKAQGKSIGKSLVEEDKIGLAKELLSKAGGPAIAEQSRENRDDRIHSGRPGKIRLPQDHVGASAFKADAEKNTRPASGIPDRKDSEPVGATASATIWVRPVAWKPCSRMSRPVARTMRCLVSLAMRHSISR
jgi:phosphoglycerate kinase